MAGDDWESERLRSERLLRQGRKIGKWSLGLIAAAVVVHAAQTVAQLF